ncbi:MAG TPA: ABC transporter substrate-binding protein [Gemmatimonadales bacterium]|jgi:iron complex transport system substrate-binding protein|nr:ABC transporter substrate-binding protein [Gemmatimonadales bacterium]
MRVVSLLPAATEIVAALGAGSYLVGVSHACDYPPEVQGLPRVTRTLVDTTRPSQEIDRAVGAARRAGTAPITVDVELVARLRPDVIIGQSVCQVCAVGDAELARLVATLMPTPWVVTLHAHTLADVLVDIRRVGDGVGLQDEAEELVRGLEYRLRRLRIDVQRAAPARRARVLVMEWLEPPYVAGHWVPELVDLAGGEAVAAVRGEPSHAEPWPQLAALAPDLVVIALCGFDVPRARTEFAAVADPVAQTLFRQPVAFLDGNAYTSRPGPRLVDAAALLVQLIARRGAA